MTTPKKIINKFNKKFPPPMLLGQNQEQLRLFIISTIIKQYDEMLEEVDKIIEDNDDGLWSGREFADIARNFLQSKIKEWKLIDNK